MPCPAPVSPYGVTKLSCEHLLRAHARNFELDYVGLRYFTVYGPRQRPDMAFARLVGSLVGGPSFEVYGDGMQSRDFTYVQRRGRGDDPRDAQGPTGGDLQRRWGQRGNAA